MIRTKAIAAAIIAATALCAPASAQTFTFNYEAWQLRSAEGRAQVLDHLERRVEAYCNVAEARRDLWRQRVAADCQERTLNQAIEQMGDARVLALHRDRTQQRQA